MTEPPAIRIRGLTKSFPGVAALRGVDLDIYPSEVHGLVGENGAGKSTLIKHLTGLYAADSGSIQLFGRALESAHARVLQQAGIGVIYQEQQLLEIMRALEAEHRILIMDEPATSLGEAEREKLYGIVGSLRRQGICIVFISHDLADVLRLCDRV